MSNKSTARSFSRSTSSSSMHWCAFDWRWNTMTSNLYCSEILYGKVTRGAISLRTKIFSTTSRGSSRWTKRKSCLKTATRAASRSTCRACWRSSSSESSRCWYHVITTWPSQLDMIFLPPYWKWVILTTTSGTSLQSSTPSAFVTSCLASIATSSQSLEFVRAPSITAS